jgi:LacI family transcriptional regulator
MGQSATILDIARELNIAVATVSRALNDHPAVKDTTRSAVLQTAKRLNYQPNKIATSLRSGKSKIVGVMIPSAEINFFGSVVHGIERVMSRNGYNVLIYQSNELYEFEKKGIETFLRSRVEGVLASISKETMNLEHYAMLKKKNVPLILFDRANDSLEVPSVVVDDYQGAFAATKHLIRQGCRTIAHIGGQQHVAIFNQRLRGYIDALNVHNIPVNDDLIVYGKVSIQSGRECMQHLLGKSPDAVFAVEDFTALGAAQAIKASGKRIPQDIAIAGFANEAFGEYITPSLTTVDQQTHRMGEAAAELFFEMTENRQQNHAVSPKKLILQPELICRQSSLKK